ncbi:DUF2691 family protein [Clostridium ganghwense]|uniref:DUF2691 family protein n=1 Tax=Clostridium ganghwense TaxID=312089 RepID=UPI00300E42B7
MYYISRSNEKYCGSFYILKFTIKNLTIYKLIDQIGSDCEIALAVYDCSYIMFWCKNNQLVSSMYNYALSEEYEDIKYISEEELLQRKYYIE